jgi:TIR domain/SIR2-like domain
MSLEPRQWNNLLEAIENGSCIVLLGPKISTVKDGASSLYEQFANELAKELKKEKISYDKAHEGNLTYIMQRYTTIPNVAPSDPGFEAKNFYKEYDGQFNTVQKTLAELPINLVINTSPDDAMVDALKKAGKFKTMHSWYDYRKEKNQEFDTPTAETPLVFNLFGYYENAMSLVLTESDQVEFMKNVIKDQPPLPPKLLSQLDSHKTYLFLGFDWEQWNLRLLLEGLNLEKECNILAHSHRDVKLQTKTKDFYESSFRFSFITENISEFVTELKAKYEEQAPSSETTQKKLSIVADPKDEDFRNELAKNLKPLAATVWHEGLIEAGSDVDATITENLENADLILLLVSADFLASDSIYKREWKVALKKFQENDESVIPIITRPCNWEQLEELKQMPLILPRAGMEVGKAISSWENVDDAYSMIVKEIQDLL